jgi:ADP-heptose:LPS heptosyltransferase
MIRGLVARLDNDGDVLLAGPAARAMAAHTGHLTLLCGPRGAAAAALLPGVDEIVVRRAEWIDPQAPPVARAAIDAHVTELARLRIDVAAILTSDHQSPLPLALLLRMAGVPHIAAISVDFPGSLLDHRLPDPGDIPESDRALGVAAALGCTLPPADDGRLRVCADAPPAALPRRYVVVHPGASVPARAWAPGRHAALVALLVDAGRAVVVTGGPAERDLTAAVAGAGAGEAVVDLGGRTTLRQLAGVLAGADAVIVGNTGPAHLAAAVGTPVVSLFAPTVPAARWRPRAVPHRLVLRDVPCAGCRARHCPMPGHPCLDEIGPAEVLVALDELVPGAGRLPTPARVA